MITILYVPKVSEYLNNLVVKQNNLNQEQSKEISSEQITKRLLFHWRIVLC